MRIWREGVVDGVIVNPAATETLRHNDRVDIVSGLPLVYVPAGTPFPHQRNHLILITTLQRSMAKNMLLRDARQSQNPHSH